MYLFSISSLRDALIEKVSTGRTRRLKRLRTLFMLLPVLLFTSMITAQDDVSIVSAPSQIQPSQTYDITLNYTASEERRVVAYLHQLPQYYERGRDVEIVSAGSGTITLSVTTDAGISSDFSYRWTCKVETLDGQPLDEAVQGVSVPFVGDAGDVTVTADFSSLTGRQINTDVFGVNVFKGFDDNITQNGTYQSRMADMNPGHIRYHSWEMIRTDGHTNSWVNSSGDWVPSKIAAAMDNNPYPDNTKLLMNIPWPPEAKGWLVSGRNSKLKSQHIDDFADWCAELVEIVNIDLGKNIEYWEFTNERDGVYAGDEATLGDIFNRCVAAARAVDPSIKVGGPAFERPDIMSRVSGFMNATKDQLDFLSLHGYPYGNVPSNNQTVYNRAANFSQDLINARNEWATISSREIEFHHNEYNLSYSPPQSKMDNEVGMLFDAIVMISMTNAGADAANAWNELDGWFGKMDQSYFREPAFYVFELYNNHLREGDIYTSSSSDDKKIVPLAVKDGNIVQVLLVNRSEADQNVFLDLSGLGTLDGSTAIQVVEAIPSGGIATNASTITEVTTGSGYFLKSNTVAVMTFSLSGDPDPDPDPMTLDCTGSNILLDASWVEKDEHASETIVTSGVVEVNTDATFTAGQSITLAADFHAKSGSLFHAYIASCEGSTVSEYQVNVTSGTGSGMYAVGDNVSIQADAAPNGQVFDQWTGDVSVLNDVFAANTSFTMPAQNVSLTATYETVSTGGDDIYYFYSESGSDFDDEGGVVDPYALIVNTITTNPYEGTEFKNITPTAHYASYDFEFPGTTDKSSWVGANLELGVRGTSNYDIVFVYDGGQRSRIGMQNYVNFSGNWEDVVMPLSDFNADFSKLEKLEIYRLWRDGDIPLDFDNVRITGIASNNATNNGNILGENSVSEVLSAPEVATAKFSVHPNPSQDFIVLKFTQEAPNKVQLLDASGKVVKEITVNSAIMNVDLSDMKAGLYICNALYANGEQETQSVIIK